MKRKQPRADEVFMVGDWVKVNYFSTPQLGKIIGFTAHPNDQCVEVRFPSHTEVFNVAWLDLCTSEGELLDEG